MLQFVPELGIKGGESESRRQTSSMEFSFGICGQRIRSLVVLEGEHLALE